MSALLFLKTDSRGQALAAFALLAGYWALMTLVPVPGHGAGMLDEEGNLAAYLNDLLLRGHLYLFEHFCRGWDRAAVRSASPSRLC